MSTEPEVRMCLWMCVCACYRDERAPEIELAAPRLLERTDRSPLPVFFVSETSRASLEEGSNMFVGCITLSSDSLGTEDGEAQRTTVRYSSTTQRGPSTIVSDSYLRRVT
jgi:hypothetical protein